MAWVSPEKQREYYRNNPGRYKEAQKRYRQTEKYREGLRDRTYKRKFGISLEMYDKMLEEQNSVCKICHCPETSMGAWGEVKRLAVDHCHDTGIVRGLLCDRCNHLLGLAKDSQTLLSSAIKYLKEAYNAHEQ